MKSSLFKLLEETILRYFKRTQESIDLPVTQKTLLIYDVFRSQTTQSFLDFPRSSIIYDTYIPLDLTLNKFNCNKGLVNGFEGRLR